jgi:hypothetical protein
MLAVKIGFSRFGAIGDQTLQNNFCLVTSRQIQKRIRKNFSMNN